MCWYPLKNYTGSLSEGADVLCELLLRCVPSSLLLASSRLWGLARLIPVSSFIWVCMQKYVVLIRSHRWNVVASGDALLTIVVVVVVVVFVLFRGFCFFL